MRKNDVIILWVILLDIHVKYSILFAVDASSAIWSFTFVKDNDNGNDYLGTIKQCYFPFRYNGTEYNMCTKENNDFLWCAYDSEWTDGKTFGRCILPNEHSVIPTECPLVGGLGGIEYDGKCYTWYGNNSITWIDAQEECESFGGHLAVADTNTIRWLLGIEQRSIFLNNWKQMPTFDNNVAWVGGLKVNSTVQWWINGKTTVFSSPWPFWEGYQLNDDDHHCMVLDVALHRRDRWNVKDCFNHEENSHAGFICEFDTDEYVTTIIPLTLDKTTTHLITTETATDTDEYVTTIIPLILDKTTTPLITTETAMGNNSKNPHVTLDSVIRTTSQNPDKCNFKLLQITLGTVIPMLIILLVMLVFVILYHRRTDRTNLDHQLNEPKQSSVDINLQVVQSSTIETSKASKAHVLDCNTYANQGIIEYEKGKMVGHIYEHLLHPGHRISNVEYENITGELYEELRV